MHRRLWVVVLFIALITTYVSSEELKKNGVVFQWNYTYLLPENYIVGEVTRNVDGNMMIVTLEKSIEFVNMLGVNTPIADHPTKAANELEKEATDFTTAMCPVGSTVYLTYDSELRDDDFRLLSFVWFKIEDIWVLQNLNLIANGYGTFDATFPLKQSYKVI